MSLYRSISVVLTANTSGLNAGLRAAAGDVRRLGSDVRKSNTELSKHNQTMSASKVAAKALQGAAVATGVALAYSVTQAVAFDSAMRNVNSLVGASEPQFAAMEKRVISMSKSLPQSATTLAEGLYDITSSGFSGAGAMDILDKSARAASAGLTTTAVSSRAITSVLNAYGLKASEAQDVSDTLFQTVNLGVVSFDELAGNLGDVVGSASAAKIGIDQVGSAIATMTLSGQGGAEATNSLSNLLQKTIRPSEALATQIEKMGFSSGAAMLQTKGLRGSMELLRKATGGNVEELLKLYPDMQAARGALALMSNEGKNYARVAAQIEDKNARAGATARTLAEQMKSARNQMQLLKNNVDAAAISLGIALLPVMIKLMKGAQLTGAELARIGRAIGKDLGPTWEALASIWKDLTGLAGGLASTVGPLATALAKLGVGAVVVTLNLIFTALAHVASIAADHKGVVLALATAYGVNLLRGLLLVNGGLRVMAWKSFGAVLVGSLNSIDKLAAGLRSLATLNNLAYGAVGAGAATLLMAWSGYKKGVNEAKAAQEALNTAINSADYHKLVTGAAQANAELARMTSFIQQQHNQGGLKGFFDIGDNYQAVGYMNQFDELQRKAQAADASIAQMRSNTIKYLMDSTSLTGGALDRWITPITHDMNKLDSQVAVLAVRAKAAGIDMGAPYPELKARLDAVGASSGSTAEAQKKLIDSLGNVGNKAVDTKTAVDNLKSALDDLLGVALSADAANDAFEAALDNLTHTLDKNGKSLSSNTAKGRENRAAIREGVSSLRDKIEADAKAGVSSSKLAKELTTGIRRLKEQAGAAGLSEGAMEKLLKQYNLTPDLVETIVKAVGADLSKEDVEALQRAIGKTKGKTVETKTAKTKESTALVDKMDAQIRKLKGKIVDVKDKGAKESDKRVQDLHAEIARLQTRHDIMFKTPGLDSAETKVKDLRDAILRIPNRSVSISVATGVANKLGAMNASEHGDGYGMDEVDVNASATGTGRAIGAVARTMKSGVKGASEAAGALGGGGGVGMGWHKQWGIIHGQFPGAQLTSSFRPGAITATGHKSYHSMGRAVDLSPSMAIFNWIRSHYGKSTKELIYSPAGNRQIHNGQNHYYTGITRRMHFNHVHWAMKKGGMLDSLPRQATIARDGADLVNWAEAGTGGEAFIPLGANNRQRSKAILAQVAEKFGMAIGETEDAIAQYATGGFHYPKFRYKGFKAPRYEKGEGRKAYRTRYRQEQNQYFQDRRDALTQYYQNRDQAAEAWRDQRRLWATATGRSAEGRQQWAGGSASGAISNISAAYESRAQATAQATANRTRSQSDTAADFYRKPNVGARQITSGLAVEVANTKRWSAQLTKIAATAGADVAASLERMGAEGADAVAAMSRSSTKDMKRMADQMRALDFAKFTADTAANARESAQFQGNLVALVKMGRADLASQFASMGYEQAGSLAAQAVKDPKGAAALAQYGKTLESGNSQGMQDALKLASILQGGRGRVGVMGLATKSGMGIADVLGLITSHPEVFGKLGSAMAQVNRDQSLLKAGKQPSGLANGGIVAGSASARGLYYRWAEPGSGGESLIPHSPARRDRAMRIWAETGRILGVQGSGRGSSGTTVLVAPGAVRVEIPISEPGASPDQIRAVATDAVGQAMRQLSHQIKAGAR